MSAPKLVDPRVRLKQYTRTTIPVASIASAGFAVAISAPAPVGYAVSPTRCTIINNVAGAALGGVGANDNLVVRSNTAAGAVLTTSGTGVGFLDAAVGAQAALALEDGVTQTLVTGNTAVLAYGPSADGVTIGAATGFLQVNLEYDFVSVQA